MAQLANARVVKKGFTGAVLFSLLAGFAGTGFAEEVAFRGHGSWNVTTGTTPNYWAEKGVWFDVTVEHLAYDKKVSILWTDDNWASSQESKMNYKYRLPNDYEVWGVEFAPLGRLDSHYIGGWANYVTGQTRAGGRSFTIEYTVKYEVNGKTYWDSNSGQNYSILVKL